MACRGQRARDAQRLNTADWLFDVSGRGLDKRAVKSEITGSEEEEGERRRMRRRRNDKDEID